MAIEAIWNHTYRDDCIPNFSNNMALPRHRWYDFKEGYGSSLVERAIFETRQATKKRQLIVLDPFSGSGTTPLTALQNNCDCIASEVNPFMSFVSKTKCIKKTCSADDLMHELESVISQKNILVTSPLQDISSFAPGNNKEKWLFNIEVLQSFEALKKMVESTVNQDLFMLALMAAVMECCNAYKDGKCLRYKKNWKSLEYDATDLRNAFKENALKVIADIESDPLILGERTFYLGDSRQTLSQMAGETADLVVFSPPYLNSFDYSDIYRPELFLGDFVNSNDDLRAIRKTTLRSHVQYKWETQEKSSSIWAQSISEKIKARKEHLWNKNIPEMVDSYFYDMERVLSEAYRVCNHNAQLWFVVSTSAYAGIEIPVDLILADLAQHQGWDLCNVNALRKLRTSSQCVDENDKKIRLRESLIICTKI